MNRGGHDKANAIAAIDLLLNLVMVFVVISVIAVVRMNKPDAGKAVEMKAELMIEMTWPDGNFDDLDLWLLTPGGRRIGFDNQDIGTALLDRDDRGAYGDLYGSDQAGLPSKLIRVNREVMTIRANVPGRYAVNVHYFHDFEPMYIGLEEVDPLPNPVTIKLTKLNPRLVEVASRQLRVDKVGSEKTAFCFELDAAGAVTNLDDTCNVPFVSPFNLEAGPRI